MDVDKLSYRFGTSTPWIRESLSEFLGTFILVFIGNCAIAQTVLSQNIAGTHLSIHLSYGFAAGFAVMVSGGPSGAHINPAVTVAFAAIRRLSWKKIPHYCLAQYFGGFIAAVMTFVVYRDAISSFDGGTRLITGDKATAGIFATYPPEFASIPTLLLDQILGSFLLMLIVCALTDRLNMEIHRSLYPLYVSLLVASLGMCLGWNHKYPLNPARDLSPRVFLTLAGWGVEAFTYRNIFWIPIVGPHIGALLGAFTYILFIEIHLPEIEI